MIYVISTMKLVLTCEHGGNDIPDNYNKQFNNKAVLKTHRAYDLGALDVFQYLKPLSNASFYSTTSRLLVELNRSLFSKSLFSEFSKNLSKNQKSEILQKYYIPHRTDVEYKIAKKLQVKNI
ncbi:N-formylglutamate amidohydrolase [Winogradskyella sp. PC D3.3]